MFIPYSPHSAFLLVNEALHLLQPADVVLSWVSLHSVSCIVGGKEHSPNGSVAIFETVNTYPLLLVLCVLKDELSYCGSAGLK